MGGSKVSIRSKDVDIMGISNIIYKTFVFAEAPRAETGDQHHAVSVKTIETAFWIHR
jgi:hypothetical protein